MTSKSALLLPTILVVVVLSLFSLYFFTPLPNQKMNGFTRKWLNKNIHFQYEKAVSLPLDKICGTTDHNIFFSLPNPRWLIMLSQDLRSQDTIFFPINPVQKTFLSNWFKIDSPWVYFFSNNEPSIIYGQMKGRRTDNLRIIHPKYLFTKSAYLSPERVVMRTFDSSKNKQFFTKFDCLSGKTINKAMIIDKQPDAGFSTDGILQYDTSTHKLVYVLNYQNRFFVMDTSLQVNYIGKTIDTTSTNYVQVRRITIDGTQRLMPSTARSAVNKYAAVGGGLLYIQSELKADNESFASFKEKTVVDIYRLTDGTYIGSFNIPNLDGEKMKSFFVKSDLFIVLYKAHIITYKINLDAI